MNISKICSLALLVSVLPACSTLNNALVEKRKSVEYYRIFDIKTEADREAIAEAASDGLGANVNNANERRPILNESLPETPGRFKTVDPFGDSKMGALMRGSGGPSLIVATCDGASWIADATREIKMSSDLKLTACLFPYKGGYHLNVYANFSKDEGGIMEIARKGAFALVGTPEEWVEKTFLDIVRNIRKVTTADVSLVEGYPKVQGTPWLDSGEKISTKEDSSSPKSH